MDKLKDIKFKVSDEDKNTIFEKTNKNKGVYANYFIIFLIFLSIVIAFLGTMGDVYNTYFYVLFIVDLFISIIFALEYLYRFKNSDKKTKFPFKFLNILDLFSFLPFFIILLLKGPGVYGLFALFRIFRIFRIIELLEKMPITLGFLRGLNKHKVEMLSGIILIFLVLISFTTLLYLVENLGGAKDVFSSLSKTLWWAIYALTTSGDAGMIPQTFIGRILAGILMVMGPILVSILSSVIVLIFLDSTSIIDLKKKDKCHKCGTKNDGESKYCKNCGKKLK